MKTFPSRVPIGIVLACALSVALAPAVYKLWLHFQGPLEVFYLGSYAKANVLPNHSLLGRPLTHRFYVVTVNGQDATPATLPTTMTTVSGRFVDVQPVLFAQWLKSVIYGGRDIGDILAVPFLAYISVCVVLLIVGATLDYRRRQRAREGEQLRGPETMTIDQFNRTTKGKEKGFALRTSR